jgi:membrane protein
MKLLSAKDLTTILSESFLELKKNDPLRLAGATAFFTTFALPPILIILIQLFALIFNIENLGDKFFNRFAEILGAESSYQIKSTFLGFKSLAKNPYITIGGTIFFIFVATTLFKVIKDTLNQLWKVRVDPKRAFLIKMEKRMVSMVVILLAGILFAAGTLAEGMQALLGKYFNEFYAGTGSFIEGVLNSIISVAVVTTWFVVLFKLLPDAKLSWKVAFRGGFFTALLFSAGKILIKRMLSLGDIHTVFGTSTSIVFLLLFVFYSAFILYYGACFTKVYAAFIKDPIKPGEHAFSYELVELKDEEGSKLKPKKS